MLAFRPLSLAVLVTVLLLALTPLMAAQAAEKSSAKPEITHLYGNHECPVSGHQVVPDASVTYSDKEKGVYGRIYLCCMGCEKKVKENVGEVYKTLYRKDKKTGKEIEPKDLKNAKCPMSGEPVDPKTKIEYNGMVVHFCCPDCAQAFLKDPETKMAKLLPDAKEFEFKPKPGSHSSK